MGFVSNKLLGTNYNDLKRNEFRGKAKERGTKVKG